MVGMATGSFTCNFDSNPNQVSTDLLWKVSPRHDTFKNDVLLLLYRVLIFFRTCTPWSTADLIQAGVAHCLIFTYIGSTTTSSIAS
jgi:hypothetical protein